MSILTLSDQTGTAKESWSNFKINSLKIDYEGIENGKYVLAYNGNNVELNFSINCPGGATEDKKTIHRIDLCIGNDVYQFTGSNYEPDSIWSTALTNQVFQGAFRFTDKIGQLTIKLYSRNKNRKGTEIVVGEYTCPYYFYGNKFVKIKSHSFQVGQGRFLSGSIQLTYPRHLTSISLFNSNKQKLITGPLTWQGSNSKTYSFNSQVFSLNGLDKVNIFGLINNFYFNVDDLLDNNIQINSNNKRLYPYNKYIVEYGLVNYKEVNNPRVIETDIWKQGQKPNYYFNFKNYIETKVNNISNIYYYDISDSYDNQQITIDGVNIVLTNFIQDLNLSNEFFPILQHFDDQVIKYSCDYSNEGKKVIISFKLAELFENGDRFSQTELNNFNFGYNKVDLKYNENYSIIGEIANSTPIYGYDIENNIIYIEIPFDEEFRRYIQPIIKYNSKLYFLVDYSNYFLTDKTILEVEAIKTTIWDQLQNLLICLYEEEDFTKEPDFSKIDLKFTVNLRRINSNYDFSNESEAFQTVVATLRGINEPDLLMQIITFVTRYQAEGWGIEYNENSISQLIFSYFKLNFEKYLLPVDGQYFYFDNLLFDLTQEPIQVSFEIADNGLLPMKYITSFKEKLNFLTSNEITSNLSKSYFLKLYYNSNQSKIISLKDLTIDTSEISQDNYIKFDFNKSGSQNTSIVNSFDANIFDTIEKVCTCVDEQEEEEISFRVNKNYPTIVYLPNQIGINTKPGINDIIKIEKVGTPSKIVIGDGITIEGLSIIASGGTWDTPS